MFGTLKTLMMGAQARAEENVRDQYAIELIDQKIREAEANLSAAKGTLASLIQRQRSEDRLLATLNTRIADLTERATEALKGEREDLAGQAATAIAELENERTLRLGTVDRLAARVLQLQSTVESAHRRIVDLKQGAITARAIRREQTIQGRVNHTLGGTSAADEAETLIKRVTNADDPFEQSQILKEINSKLDHTNVAETMADAGFGPAMRSTQVEVLARLRAKI